MSYKALFMPLLLLMAGLGCFNPEEGSIPDEPMSETATNHVDGRPKQEEPLDKDFPLRAVSLRALQQMLAACTPQRTCSDEILQVGRITRLLGYSLDPERRDVVIYGLADPGLPRLHIEDLVVALRSSWLKYARQEGKTYYLTYPGCDIRPEPALVLRLQSVGQKLVHSPTPEKAESVLREWRQTCELPQAVTVLGVPLDTRFGQVMVAADYDMKRLADGSDALDIPGLVSVMDLKLRTVEDAVRKRRPISLKVGMDRFWLTRSDQVYAETDGNTWIRSCPVSIRTSPTGADANGNLSDTAGSDPEAEAFASRFSALYPNIARRRPIYSELRGLFQVFALTQLLHFQDAPRQAGLDITYLLDVYPVPAIPVRREVPGRQAVRRFRHESAEKGGTEIVQLWMPSCGGVEMPIEPAYDKVRISYNHQNPMQSVARMARPTSEPSGWNVPTDELEGFRSGVELEEINQPGGPLFARVEDQRTQYQLFSHGATYKGLDTGVLLRKLLPVAAQQGTKTVYLDLRSFPREKAEIFTEDCRLRLHQINQDMEVRFLINIEGSPRVKSLFSPGLRVLRTTPARPVTEGRLRGLYRGFITFVVEAGGKLVEVTVAVVGASAVLVDAFLERFGAVTDLSGSLPLSFVHRADQVRREMKREFGDLVDDLINQIEDELGNSHYVDLAPTASVRAA